jgi:hypothetical protein
VSPFTVSRELGHAERLAKLAFVTTIVTTGTHGAGHDKPRNREAETGSVIQSGRRDSNPGPPAPKARDRGSSPRSSTGIHRGMSGLVRPPPCPISG